MHLSHKTNSNYRNIPIPYFLLKKLSDFYNDDNYYRFKESQNKPDTIINIIELQNRRLNNNVIENKLTILLEHKETLT